MLFESFDVIRKKLDYISHNSCEWIPVVKWFYFTVNIHKQKAFHFICWSLQHIYTGVSQWKFSLKAMFSGWNYLRQTQCANFYEKLCTNQMGQSDISINTSMLKVCWQHSNCNCFSIRWKLKYCYCILNKITQSGSTHMFGLQFL